MAHRTPPSTRSVAARIGCEDSVDVGAFCLIASKGLWALDFQFDRTIDGRQIKLLNVIDEYKPRSIAIGVDHSIGADDFVAALMRTDRHSGGVHRSGITATRLLSNLLTSGSTATNPDPYNTWTNKPDPLPAPPAGSIPI